MTTKERLIDELDDAPEELLEAVLSFVLAAKQTSHAAQTSDFSEPHAPHPVAANGLQAVLDLLDALPPLSPEELATMPHDGAENHDHYLYGAPKN
ncbi:MAG TPA: hypothetical protein V6C88_08160 [Chroococcidiopsis sp.]